MGLTEKQVREYFKISALVSVRIVRFVDVWVVEFVGSDMGNYYLKTARSESARSFKDLDRVVSLVKSFGFNGASMRF